MKRCAICHTDHDVSAASCSGCGEASWVESPKGAKPQGDAASKAAKAKRAGKKSSPKGAKPQGEESEVDDQPGADGADDNETR